MSPKYGQVEDQMLKKLWLKFRNMRISGPGVRVTNTDETFTCNIDPPRSQAPLSKVSAAGLVTLSVGAPGTRGAMYSVTVIKPPTADILTTGSSPVTASELGTSGGTGMGINVLEIADGTNNLTAGTIALGSLLYTNSDGTKIYEFWDIAGLSCSGASS